MDKEKYIGESSVLGSPKKKLNLIIKEGSVTTDKIADEAVTTSKLADSSVKTDKIADKAVTKAKLSNELVKYIEDATGFSEEFVEEIHGYGPRIEALEAEASPDDALSLESENTVQNKVVTEALGTKQDVLIPGENISIVENIISSKDTIYDDTSLKEEVATKANASDVYTKTEADAALELKADKTALASTDEKVAANTEAITAETTRATAAEEANAIAIANEATTARAAEKANADAISAEETRALAAEKVLSDSIASTNTALNEEITRAKAAEETNANAITAEATRATTEEKKILAEFDNIKLEGSDLTYTLTVGDRVAGTIIIPEDQFLKSAAYSAETKSLVFVFKTSEGEVTVNVDVSDLVDIYTAGNGLALTSNQFSIKVSSDSENFLTVDEGGIKVTGIQTAIDGAKTELQASITTISEAVALKADASSVYTKTEIDNKNFATKDEVGTKQDILTAGANITISETNEISASIPEEYVTESELTAKDYATKTEVSAKQDTLEAGDNITILNNVISSKDTIYDDTAIKESIATKANSSDVYTKEEINSMGLVSDVSELATKTELNNKQDKLTPGDNITIENNVISATDTVYDDTQIKNDIASKQSTLTPGDNISIVENVISASIPEEYVTNTELEAKNYATEEQLNTKQDTLTPGDNITITEGVISATDTVYDDTAIKEAIAGKQDALVSGQNIKTINGNSLLGEGDIAIEGGSGSTVVLDTELSDTSENGVQNKVITAALGTKQDTLTVGENITIVNNTISATDTVYDDTEIKAEINKKQNILSAGTNITITGDTISASVPSGYITETELEAKGYATTTQVNAKQDKLTAGNGIAIENNEIKVTLDTTLYKVVDTLPTEGIEENKIYLVASSTTGDSNIYTEYMYVNAAWEKVGEYSSSVDLVDYLKTADAADTYLSKTDASSTYLTKTDASTTYLGKTEKAASASTADSATTATTANKTKGTLTFTGGSTDSFDGSADVSVNIPTSNSQLDNDAGYITSAGSITGNAATATALTTSAGNATTPVYFENGKPVALDYTIAKSVPSNAVFTDTTYSAATTSANGLMTSAMVTKLNGIATGAEVNQNAFTNVVVGSTTIAADAKSDSLTLVAGSNVTITPDATNDKITIAATNTTYSAATSSAAGLLSASDKAKLDGITASADSVAFTQSLTSGTEIGVITINGVSTTLYCEESAPVVETVYITLGGNQAQPDAALVGLTIHVTYGETDIPLTWDGSTEMKTNILMDTEYTVTFPSLEGYTTPSAVTYTAAGGNTRRITGDYNTTVVSVNINTNQSGDTTPATAGVSVTIAYGTTTKSYTWAGTTITQKIPVGQSYTITCGALDDYKTPSAQTATATAAAESVTMTYQTEVVTISVSTYDSVSVAGQVVTINSDTYTLTSSGTLSVKIAYGVSYTISLSAMSKHTTPSAVSYTAGQASRAISMVYEQLYEEAVTVTATASDGESMAGTKITVTIDGTATEYSSPATFNVVHGISYTISAAAVSGYKTPTSVSYTASQESRAITMQYQTEVVTVNVSADDSSSVAGQVITINGTDYTLTASGSVTTKIATGTSYSVSANEKSGYNAPATQTFTAGTGTRTVSMVYEVVPESIITIDQSITDPATMISGDVNGTVIQWIRSNSHRVLAKKTAEGQVTYCRLNDSNSNQYYDGTTAVLTGDEGDVFLKLPTFYYKGTEGDSVQIHFALSKLDDTYVEWDTNALIGVYEAYSTSSMVYSRSGVASTANISQANFNTYAANRGTGYQIVDWQMHCIMGCLFYAQYGHTNCQEKIGLGTNSYTKTTGQTDSLGMTDTVGSGGNGDSQSINFWGLENWWGNKFEWIGNMVVTDRVWVVTEADGTERTAGTGYSDGGYITKMLFGQHLDMIPTAAGGSSTTGFCDYYVHYTGTRVVLRSYYCSYTYDGVAFVLTYYDASNTGSHYGSRLAFRGECVEAESVAAYKAL